MALIRRPSQRSCSRMPTPITLGNLQLGGRVELPERDLPCRRCGVEFLDEFRCPSINGLRDVSPTGQVLVTSGFHAEAPGRSAAGFGCVQAARSEATVVAIRYKPPTYSRQNVQSWQGERRDAIGGVWPRYD